MVLLECACCGLYLVVCLLISCFLGGCCVGFIVVCCSVVFYCWLGLSIVGLFWSFGGLVVWRGRLVSVADYAGCGLFVGVLAWVDSLFTFFCL